MSPRKALWIPMVILCAIALHAGETPAQTQPAQARSAAAELARYVPGTVLGAVVIPDGERFVRGFRATGIAALGRESDVAALIDESFATLAPDIERVEAVLGYKLSAIPHLFEVDALWAITGFGLPKDNPFLREQILIVRPRTRAAETLWRQIEARAVRALQEAVPGPGIQKGQVAGMPIDTISKGGTTIKRAWRRGHLVVGSNSPVFAHVLGALAVPLDGVAPRGSLAAREGYRAVVRELTQPGESLAAFGFLNAEELLSKVILKAATKEREKLEKLGLTDVRGVGIGTGLGPSGGFVDRIVVDAPQAHRGLFMALRALGRLDAAPVLRRTPGDAFLAAAIDLSPSALYHVVQHLVRTTGGPDAIERFDQALDGFEREFGFGLYEVLKDVSGQATLYASMPDGGEGLYPEITARFRLKDAERAQAHLDAILARLTQAGADRPALDVRTIPSPDGSTFRYVNLASLGGVSPIEPAFAIVGEDLLVALTPMHLKRVLERERGYAAETAVGQGVTVTDGNLSGSSKAGPGAPRAAPSLASSPAWTPVADEVGKDIHAFAYLDAPKILRGLYNTYGPFFQAASDKGELPFEPALLPTATTVSKHLRSATLTFARRPTGYAITLRGPLSPFVFLGTAATIDAFGKLSRKEAERRLLAGEPDLAAVAARAMPAVDYSFDRMDLARGLEELASRSGVSIFFPRESMESVQITARGEQVQLDRAVAALLEGTSYRARARAVPGGGMQIVVYEVPDTESTEGTSGAEDNR